MALSDLTSRDAVLAAIREFDAIGQDEFLSKYGFGKARQYVLELEGKLYDSKAIVGAAHGYQFPDIGPLKASTFSGGEATVRTKLRSLGFRVLSAGAGPAPSLNAGTEYTWEELGREFGFAPDYLAAAGGMVPRPKLNAVLLITHPGGGKAFDYQDYWDDNGDLIYTGKGQEGDQKLQGANLDVAENRRILLVFEGGRPKHLKFLGTANCVDYFAARAPGKDGGDRQVWKFRLRFHEGGESAVTRRSRAEAIDREHSRTPADRRPRAFDPNMKPTPRTRREGVERRTPEETLAEQEKANQAHHALLQRLHEHLKGLGWNCLEEIPVAIDLWGQGPSGSRTIFEAKTIDGNEIHQARAAIAQLLEYRFLYGKPEDRLCVVTDQPLSDLRQRLLRFLGFEFLCLPEKTATEPTPSEWQDR
jgi:hypothetical protein